MRIKFKKEMRETWFKGIRERLAIRNITSSILYEGCSLLELQSFSICEEKAEKEIKKALDSISYADGEVLNAFQEYKTALKEIHFELGVRIGICLVTELLRNDLN